MFLLSKTDVLLTTAAAEQHSGLALTAVGSLTWLKIQYLAHTAGTCDEKGNFLLSKGVGTYQTTLTRVALGVTPLISRKWWGFCLPGFKILEGDLCDVKPPNRGEPILLQYKETTVTPGLLYTLPLLLLKKGRKLKKKNPSFCNISIHIYRNKPYCPHFLKNQRPN